MDLSNLWWHLCRRVTTSTSVTPAVLQTRWKFNFTAKIYTNLNGSCRDWSAYTKYTYSARDKWGTWADVHHLVRRSSHRILLARSCPTKNVARAIRRCSPRPSAYILDMYNFRISILTRTAREKVFAHMFREPSYLSVIAHRWVVGCVEWRVRVMTTPVGDRLREKWTGSSIIHGLWMKELTGEALSVFTAA
jgi:hypothetical protein